LLRSISFSIIFLEASCDMPDDKVKNATADGIKLVDVFSMAGVS